MEQSPSTGKTVAIAASIPIALQDVLWTVLHELYGYEWATPRFIASLVLLASFFTAGLMHLTQRRKENEQSNIAAGAIGGAPAS